MQKKRTVLGALLFLALGGLCLTLFAYREEGGRRLLEFSLNQSAPELFRGSVRLGRFGLGKNFKIRLGPLQGRLHIGTEPLPLEIRTIESEGSAARLFSREGLLLKFEGLRFENSPYQGMRGTLRLQGRNPEALDLAAEIQSLGLEEMGRLNPENLSGSTGEVKGEILLKRDAQGKIEFRARLRVEPPGGKLPSRFFEPLLPYLPQFAIRRSVRKIVATRGLVDYRDALLEIESVQTDTMKIFLRLKVPEYNLDLHVNMEIRF